MNLTLLELALGVAHREKLSNLDLEGVFGTISGKSCQAAEKEEQSIELPSDAQTLDRTVRKVRGAEVDRFKKENSASGSIL